MSKNKILLSLIVIGAVSALAIGGTIAYFSDTETSTGNTFAAGTLDLKVDSTCHYDGMVCTNGTWQEETTDSSTYPELIGQDCACTWAAKDLDSNDVLFSFDDVKPGDNGENTISLHVINNDAYVCAQVANLTNDDNGCNEPEGVVDSTCGPNEGELQNKLLFTVWKDLDCNNILDGQEVAIVEDVPVEEGYWPIADSNTGGPIPGGDGNGDPTCVGVAWELDGPTTGNEVQSDSMTADISFYAVQSRNNDGYVCGQ